MSTIEQEMVVGHFIVSDDVERSRRFYTDVLGGRTVISGERDDEVERAGRPVPDAAEATRDRDPLLHPRS